MTYNVEVEEKLQEVLEDNLTDPNKDRRNKGGQFVFTDSQNVSGSYPYILITLLDNQKTGFGIGLTDSRYDARIQVTIRVGKTNKFHVNGDLREQGYVKNFLAERIDEIVQDNQDKFRGLGEDIFLMLPDSSNPNSPGNSTQVSNDYILERRRK